MFRATKRITDNIVALCKMNQKYPHFKLCGLSHSLWWLASRTLHTFRNENLLTRLTSIMTLIQSFPCHRILTNGILQNVFAPCTNLFVPLRFASRRYRLLNCIVSCSETFLERECKAKLPSYQVRISQSNEDFLNPFYSKERPSHTCTNYSTYWSHSSFLR